MIKIGCNFLSLKDTSVEEFIQTAYDLRLDVVDFHQKAFEGMSEEALGKIKQSCLNRGLPIGYIGVSGLFVGTEMERKAHVEKSKEAVDLAFFLGSPIIRLFCAIIPEKNGDGDDPWPGMISGYQEVADYAATKGVSVGLQNHPSTGDDMLRIRGDVNRANFNFIMDTGQWIGSPGGYEKERTDVDFYGFMEQVAPHAMYIRCKFYEIENGTEAWIDYGRIVPIIQSVKYNGCISIVYEGKAEDRVEQVRKSALYLRTHLC